MMTFTRGRLLKGQELRAFKPQTSWLSLITSGSKYAVATKGWLCLEVCASPAVAALGSVFNPALSLEGQG